MLIYDKFKKTITFSLLDRGVDEVFLLDHIENLAQIFVGLPASHRQVVQQVVPAVAGGGSGHFALEVTDKPERLTHESYNISRFEVALHKEIVAGAAPHRPPEHDFAAPHRVVTQISGGKMLDCVQCAIADSRFAIGLFHANIEGCDHMVAHVIFARDLDSTQQVNVVDSKAGYLFHIGWYL